MGSANVKKELTVGKFASTFKYGSVQTPPPPPGGSRLTNMYTYFEMQT